MIGRMNRAPAAGLVERAINEAVGAFAAPKMRAAAVELALRWERLDEVPELGPSVRTFIEGALYRAVEQMLGSPVADAVQAELAPIVEMVADDEISAVRTSRPPDGAESEYPELSVSAVESEPAPVAPEARPSRNTAPEPMVLRRVLVATMDPASVSDVSRWLGGTALVQPVRDALEVLDNLDDRESDMVVVDCRRPAVSVETLLALAPEMPEDSRVVLWGERHDLEHHLSQLGSGMPSGWICCGPDASAEDVAAVVRILIE